jgi:hypothetical protein
VLSSAAALLTGFLSLPLEPASSTVISQSLSHKSSLPSDFIHADRSRKNNRAFSVGNALAVKHLRQVIKKTNAEAGLESVLSNEKALEEF